MNNINVEMLRGVAHDNPHFQALVEQEIQARLTPVIQAIEKLEKTFNGDSNDAEHDAAEELTDLLRNVLHLGERPPADDNNCPYCGSTDVKRIRMEEDDKTYECNECDAQFGPEDE